MTAYYWYGGTAEHEGEADHIANWRDVSDGSVALALPTDGDTVYIDGRAALDASGKRQSLDDGLTAATFGAPDLAGLYVSSTFDGDIGTFDADGDPTAWWELEADGDDIVLAGSGRAAIQLSAGTGADADCGRCIVNNARGTVHLASLENDVSNRGLWAEVLVLAASAVKVAAATPITTLEVFGEATVTVAAGCVDANNSSAAMTILQTAGTLTTYSPIADYYGYGGGTCYWGDGDQTPTTGLDADTITSVGANQFYWQCPDTDASIVGAVYVLGGSVHAARSTNAGYAKQLGTGSAEISELHAGTLKLDNGLPNITLASGSSIRTSGGTLSPPSHQSLAW